jgi:hypothetical protein
MKIPPATIDWLLEYGSPAVRFNTRLLTGAAKPNRQELLSDPLVKQSITLLKKWGKEVLERHNKPDLLMHRLSFLADLGVRANDPGMGAVVTSILAHANEQGIPEILIRIPPVFGGSGLPERAWIICDFPVILSGLLGMGVKNKTTGRAVKTLVSLADDRGFLCQGSFPKFRGPGRKEDFCPIACVYAAKALSLDTKTAGSEAAHRAVEALLGHWSDRKKKKYYLFGIGTDFQKLKLPFVWYNLLHVLDTVSRFPAFHKDRRVKEMATVLLAKADDGLRFKPESAYVPFKGMDFADKKNPSPTITLMALRILQRLGYFP